MPIEPFGFSPSDGWRDTTSFEAKPANEGRTRELLQLLFDQLKDYINESLVPMKIVGEVIPFAGPTAPSGTLLCDGSAVSRTTYAALFAAIGTAWGAGDGSTTFNLPNMKGRALIGAGTAESGTTYTLGTKGGEEKHAQTSDENGPHTHTVKGAGNVYQLNSTSYIAEGDNDGLQVGYHTQTTTSSGNGTPHNNMQPWAATNYIIVY